MTSNAYCSHNTVQCTGFVAMHANILNVLQGNRLNAVLASVVEASTADDIKVAV